MKDYINKINFPVLDISIDEWNLGNVSEVIFYDIYFYSESYKLFTELRLNHRVVDSNGVVFKIIRLQDKKRSLLRFFIKPRREMMFEELEERIDLNDLKRFMLGKIANLEGNEYKFKWIENIKKALTFKELIGGV